MKLVEMFGDFSVKRDKISSHNQIVSVLYKILQGFNDTTLESIHNAFLKETIKIGREYLDLDSDNGDPYHEGFSMKEILEEALTLLENKSTDYERIRELRLLLRDAGFPREVRYIELVGSIYIDHDNMAGSVATKASDYIEAIQVAAGKSVAIRALKEFIRFAQTFHAPLTLANSKEFIEIIKQKVIPALYEKVPDVFSIKVMLEWLGENYDGYEEFINFCKKFKEGFACGKDDSNCIAKFIIFNRNWFVEIFNRYRQEL